MHPRSTPSLLSPEADDNHGCESDDAAEQPGDGRRHGPLTLHAGDVCVVIRELRFCCGSNCWRSSFRYLLAKNNRAHKNRWFPWVSPFFVCPIIFSSLSQHYRTNVYVHSPLHLPLLFCVNNAQNAGDKHEVGLGPDLELTRGAVCLLGENWGGVWASGVGGGGLGVPECANSGERGRFRIKTQLER